LPTNKYEDLFIVDTYQGKIKGIKFKNEFLDWIVKYIREERKAQQPTLF
jgi:N12 class adenine-specific DNA methylase